MRSEVASLTAPWWRLGHGSPHNQHSHLGRCSPAWVSAGPWLAQPTGDMVVPRAQSARCRLLRSAPSVRLKLTGSGGRVSWVLGNLALRRAEGAAGIAGSRPPSSRGVGSELFLGAQPCRSHPANSRVSVERDPQIQYLCFER